MNLPDTVVFLTWLSQYDSRYKVTDASVQIWHNALSGITASEAMAATLGYYKTNEEAMATPAIIRKHAHSERDRATAKQSALTAAPVVRHPNTFRQRNPELWDQLFREGQETRRANLRAKGIAA